MLRRCLGRRRLTVDAAAAVLDLFQFLESFWRVRVRARASFRRYKKSIRDHMEADRWLASSKRHGNCV